MADSKARSILTSEWTVIGATLLYLSPAAFVSITGGKMEFVMYVLVMVILAIPIYILHRTVKLHPVALWGLSLWGLLHMCGGLVPVPHSWPVSDESYVLYNWWIIPRLLKYDQLIHAYGFGLTTWICWQALCSAFKKRGVNITPSFGLLVLCVAAGMGFGGLNEVIEFTAVLLIPETNVGGYYNTGWDLISNLTGCVIAAILIRLWKKPNFTQHAESGL